MTWIWRIGDPIDDATGGSMDAQNWGHRPRDEDEDEDSDFGRKWIDPRIEEYGKKAWDLYNEFKEEEALHYIDMALDLDGEHANNWNRKAIILEAMKRYDESEKCYDRALELYSCNLFYENKAKMLDRWSCELVEESKKLPDGVDMLNEAGEKIIKAIRALPSETEEDIEKYLHHWDSVNFYIGYERRYQRNLESMKRYGRDELFTIAGRHFYDDDFSLFNGQVLNLVKEEDNEFDGDAIAVYANDEKVGYVANSENTKHPMTSSASELQGRFQDTAQGRYMFHLERHADVQFHIGRLISE